MSGSAGCSGHRWPTWTGTGGRDMELLELVNEAAIVGTVELVVRDRDTDEVTGRLRADLEDFRVVEAEDGFFDYGEDPVTSIYAGDGPDGPEIVVEVSHFDDSGTLGFTHIDGDGNLIGGLVVHEFDSLDERDRWISDGFPVGDRTRGPLSRHRANRLRATQPDSLYVDHRDGR